MNKQITCPTCKTQFNIEEVLMEDVEKALKEKYELQNQTVINNFKQQELELQKQQADFEEKKKRENELFIDKINKEKEVLKKTLAEEIKKKTEEEQKVTLDFLHNQLLEKDNKLKALNEKELEVLNLNKLLIEQKEREEFNLKKQKLDIETELRQKVSDELLGKEREKSELEKRELEKQLADQKKLIEQMSRKIEQGSMQTQGEVQELMLEEILQKSFPYDVVTEVGKGKRGADCILIIKNEMGYECGKIIFESKRTKEFKKEWLGKLKEDLIEANCDISVLVTQVTPDDMTMFEQRESVWICKMHEVVHLVKALREGIINVARANKSNENKGEKKEMLYNYFTSNEFLQQMRAINEAYFYLKSSIDKERFQMEKIWKEREKQIDKVLLNNNYLLGTIKGIAGSDVEDMLLE